MGPNLFTGQHVIAWKKNFVYGPLLDYKYEHGNKTLQIFKPRAHNMCKSGLDPIDCKSINCFLRIHQMMQTGVIDALQRKYMLTKPEVS